MADVIVKCPTCDKAVAWVATAKYRPFCWTDAGSSIWVNGLTAIGLSRPIQIMMM